MLHIYPFDLYVLQFSDDKNKEFQQNSTVDLQNMQGFQNENKIVVKEEKMEERSVVKEERMEEQSLLSLEFSDDYNDMVFSSEMVLIHTYIIIL